MFIAPSPQGLARLLELLSDWFNLTLGDKLLDHLKHWMTPDKSLVAGTVVWKPGEDAQVREHAWCIHVRLSLQNLLIVCVFV